ncbi:hypothetical protein Salat_1069300 [Sesamum alatum]|uniref:Uncharacterized protein n=1 Tax=Sesamum alatum TaxID=300844 RepID=A0AAE2CSM2_9LAMI|nr:hypothetical protein Salat_1069300 [Sesamum alatum]
MSKRRKLHEPCNGEAASLIVIDFCLGRTVYACGGTSFSSTPWPGLAPVDATSIRTIAISFPVLPVISSVLQFELLHQRPTELAVNWGETLNSLRAAVDELDPSQELVPHAISNSDPSMTGLACWWCEEYNELLGFAAAAVATVGLTDRYGVADRAIWSESQYV